MKRGNPGLILKLQLHNRRPVFTEVVLLLGESILEVVWPLSLSHILEKLMSIQTMELRKGEGTREQASISQMLPIHEAPHLH